MRRTDKILIARPSLQHSTQRGKNALDPLATEFTVELQQQSLHDGHL